MLASGPVFTSVILYLHLFTSPYTLHASWALAGLALLQGESTSFKAHNGAVRSVAFSHSGESLITASDDKSVKVWSVPRQRFQFAFKGV